MWRNKFHITPKVGLLNDPNGLIYYKGEYHIFYQWNPLACEHGAKHWAHRKSKDLIEWEELPTALEPRDWYDIDGCYSGSAIEKNGILYLIYTGNVKRDGERYSYQCIARSSDGINFEKLGPIIDDSDIPKGYTKHFRDPKFYFDDGKYFMVIGAQRENLKGTALKYESKDLFNWKFLGEILSEDFGFMCECPDSFNMAGEEVLIFSPQGIEAQGDLYNNIYQSGYILNGNQQEFIELDRGFEFYAPQTFIDEFGDRVLIGWMGMPDDKEPPSIKAENWVYSLTLPRKLELKNKKIFQTPHKNLKKLRKNKIILEELVVDNLLDLSKLGVSGKTYELIIHFDEESPEFQLNIRKSETEKTSIEFSKRDKKIILNRNLSGQGYSGVRKCKVERLDKLHLFVDRSSVEVFLNDGAEVLTSSIYPSLNSLNIDICSKKLFNIPRLEFYEI